MHLPDGHGLGLLQRLRAAGHRCDVIAVTSARDADVVRGAVTQGVVLYLLKPFTFATFRAKLEQYAAYRASLPAADAADLDQEEVDALLGSLRATAHRAAQGHERRDPARGQHRAPRGRQRPVRHRGRRRRSAPPGSPSRRYLEHLADAGQAERQPRYGGSGRPEVEYRRV